jgi:hypothetical protein
MEPAITISVFAVIILLFFLNSRARAVFSVPSRILLFVVIMSAFYFSGAAVRERGRAEFSHIDLSGSEKSSFSYPSSGSVAGLSIDVPGGKPGMDSESVVATDLSTAALRSIESFFRRDGGIIGTESISFHGVKNNDLDSESVTSRTIRNRTIRSEDLAENISVDRLTVDGLTVDGTTDLETISVSGNVSLSEASYINWGDIGGEDGFGFRSDSGKLQYRNGGGGWTDIGSGSGGIAIGDSVASAVSGSILFAGVGGVLSQDNGNLFWNATDHRFGIGTGTPSTTLDVNGIITATGGNSTNWNTAYGWGNHASAGYLASASYTASDVLAKLLTVDGPTSNLDADTLDGHDTTYFYPASNPSFFITDGNTNWDNTYGFIISPDDTVSGTELDGVFSTTGVLRRTASGTYSTVTDNSTNWNTAYGWGNHASAGYLTSYTETDPVFGTSSASGITGTNITNWNQAYGWGNHASAGYLASASYTAADVLAKLLTVDGPTSNLDADTLDGLHASSFQTALTNPVTGTGSAGHLPYWSSSSALTHDADGNLFWDATNNRLGVGTTSPREKLQIVGNLEVGSASSGAKSYRLRTSGGALDFEGSGAGLFMSVWSGFDYLGTQYQYLALNTAGTATASNTWRFNNTLALREGGTSPSFYTTFQGGDQSANITYTLPIASADGILRNTSGILSWDTSSYLTDFGMGDTLASATQGSILFAGASGVLAQDNMKLFWDNGNDRLGIGTTTPTEALSVAGNMEIAGNIVPATNDTYALGSPTRVWKDLYVGPGSIYVNGQKVLQTDLSDSVIVSADDEQNLIFKTTGGGNVEVNPGNADGGQFLVKGNLTLTGGRSFQTSNDTPVLFPDGLSANALAGTDALALSSGGTDEDITLTPSGTGRVIAHGIFGLDASSYINFGTTYGTSGYGLRDNAGVLEYKNVSGSWASLSGSSLAIGNTVASATQGSILFAGALGVLAQDNANFFYNETTHRLSLGAGASPLARLHINGGTGALSTGLVFGDGDTGFYESSDDVLRLQTAGADRVTVDASGNVGIGTTSPSQKLEVSGSIIAANNAGYYLNDVQGNDRQILYLDTTNDLHIKARPSTANGIHFWTGSTLVDNMVISGNGNVGIGTTSPTAKLQIKGTGTGTGVALLTQDSAGKSGLSVFDSGVTTLQGSTATDYPTLGAELLTGGTWTSTDWTGDASGWTHTTGNVSPLSYSATVTVGNLYEIKVIRTGGTTGTATMTIGGAAAGTISAGAATYYHAPKATATTGLVITPGSTFDGTIVVSVKQITAVSTPLYSLLDSTGTARMEMRVGTATGNTFIGIGAGRYNTTGNNNSAQGYAALFNNTTGTQNSAQGMYALYSNTTGSYNSAQGYAALINNTTGSNNSAQGMYALNSNTTGERNSAQGYAALYSNTTGSYNSAQGYIALYSNTTGGSNSAQGYAALYSNTTGNYNSAQGVSAGRYIADGTTANATGSNSLFLGANTRALADGQTNQIVIGDSAIGLGSNTVVLGNSSITTTVLRGNVGIGTTTPAQKLDIASGNVRIDNTTYASQFGVIYKGADTFIHDFNYGLNGGGITTVGNNVFIGKEAGNFTMGSTATSNYHGSFNAGIGYQALRANTTGYVNFGMGAYALRSNTTGYANVAVGYAALYTNTTGAQNLGMGYESLHGNISGNQNTAVGPYALREKTSGSNDTAIGCYAGRYLADGTTANATSDNSVFIGASTRAAGAGQTNQIVIGASAIGLGSNTVVLGNSNITTTALRGNVGINTNSPTSRLHVAGTTSSDVVRSDMGFDINTVANSVAPAISLVAEAGNVDAGTHYYYTSFYTASGETHLVRSNPLVLTTDVSNGKVSITLPVSTDPRVIGRKVYRTKAGAAPYTDVALVATIANNADTSYVDNIADASISGTYYWRENTTSRFITAGGSSVMFFGLGFEPSLVMGTNAGTSYFSGTATGGANVILGGQAGGSITTGSKNVFIGNISGGYTTTGGSNNAVGWAALRSNTTGSGNSAFGVNALTNNTTNSYNAAFGGYSLYNNTTGGYNSAFGYGALYGNTTGNYNVAIGVHAGRYHADGSTALTDPEYSVYLGYGARGKDNNDHNSIVIGNSAIGLGANTVVLGNSSITTTALRGNVGIGTESPEESLHVSKNSGSSRTAIEVENTSTDVLGVASFRMKTGASSNIWQFFARNGDFFYGVANVADYFTIKGSNGYVGIKTSSPGSNLGVQGNLAVGDSTYSNIAAPTNGAIVQGNVGIGTTSPTSKLHINGTLGALSGGLAFGDGDTGLYEASDDVLRLQTAGADRVTVDASGNVGIGTGSPIARLQIGTQDGTSGGGDFYSFNSGGNPRFLFGDAAAAGNYGGLRWDSTNDYISLYTDAAGISQLVLLENGNVGIGTTTPAQKLDIASGNVRIDNTTYASQYGVIYKGADRFIHNFNYGLNGGGITTLGQNTFIGINAGNFSMGSTATQTYHGSNNLGIGVNSLSLNTTGYNNTALGNSSMYSNTTGSQNIAVGRESLQSNTTGSNNTAVGYQSLQANTIGANNVGIGINSGRYLADGTTANATSDNSVFIGASTRAAGAGQTNQIVIGASAIGLGANTVVLGNSSITKTALRGNVGIGTESPLHNLSVNGNAWVYSYLDFGGDDTTPDGRFTSLSTVFRMRGYTGRALSFGSNNISDRLWLDTTGNVGIGTTTPTAKLQIKGEGTGTGLGLLVADSAGTAGLTVRDDGIVGLRASSYLNFGSTDGATGYGIRDNAGTMEYKNSAGSWTALSAGGGGGMAIGGSVTSATAGSILFADGSGQLAQDNANFFWDDSVDRLGLGTASPNQQLELTGSMRLPVTISATTGVIYKGANRFIHDFAASGTGGQNTFVGVNAGSLTLTGSDSGSEGSYNVAFGNSALSALSTGAYNVAIGREALRDNQSGSNSIAIGSAALLVSTASDNLAIGYNALSSNTTGSSNTGIGSEALRYNSTGQYNVAFGYRSGRSASGYNIYYNTLIGNGSGQNVRSNSNVMLGYNAGTNTTTGGANILVGNQAGDNLTTGSNNLLIGYNVDAQSDTGSNQLSIGNLIFGTGGFGTGTTVGTGNIGIGTTAPNQKLSIAGTVGILEGGSAPSFYTIFQGGDQAANLTYTLPTALASAGQQLTDVNGDGILSWSAAGSLRSMKDIDSRITDPTSALETLLATDIYGFHYKPGMGTGDSETRYVGVMADEASWAMHYDGRVINPVNTLGYMVLGIQATNQKIDTLNLRTDQSVTTLGELRSSVDTQLSVVSGSLSDSGKEIDSLDSRILSAESGLASLVSTMADYDIRFVDLESEMDTLRAEHLALMEFYSTFELDSVVKKDGGNNVDLLDGRLSAKIVETGGLVITVTDPDAATIGTASIAPVGTDGDESDSDGKSLFVKTKAVTEGSRIFVTPDIAVPIAVTERKSGEGFRVSLDDKTEESVRFDWVIITE